MLAEQTVFDKIDFNGGNLNLNLVYLLLLLNN